MKARGDCAAYVGGGLVRLNRQPTDKPHARLRVGDVLTLPVPEGRGGEIRVLRVLALAARRGPAAQARGLYAELAETGRPGEPCAKADSAAYPRD